MNYGIYTNYIIQFENSFNFPQQSKINIVFESILTADLRKLLSSKPRQPQKKIIKKSSDG